MVRRRVMLMLLVRVIPYIVSSSYKQFWNWIGAVRFQILSYEVCSDKRFVICTFFTAFFYKLCGMEQRRWHQDAVQPVEHQSTSPRKCVQQKWSSTGKTADAVGSAFQTSGCWRPSASAETRSACRNRHKLVFRLRDTERRVCQNSSRVATLGRTPW